MYKFKHISFKNGNFSATVGFCGCKCNIYLCDCEKCVIFLYYYIFRYIFLEFKDRASAEEAVKQRDNYKLDKQHTFECNIFTDFDKYEDITDEFVAPTPQPYKVR